MNEFLIILKSFSIRRLLNLITTRVSLLLSYLFKKPVLYNQPWAITIEPSATCQLSCPECPVGMKDISRKNIFLSNDDFSTILKGISTKTFWLNLYFQGEPLLDNGITEKIKMATEKKMYVVLSTNAIALNKNLAIDLCNAGLSKIIISLDGADEQTHLKYRQGGNYNNTIKAIQYLRDAKKNRKSPIIEVQMLVFSYNENQKKELRKTALKLGANKVVFKSPQFYDMQNATENMSSDKKYQRYKRKSDGRVLLNTKRKKICKRLWNTMVINSDGDVVVCCYDKFSKHVMGNAVENKATSIWENEKFNNFRLEFLKGKQKEICSNCL